MDYQGDSDSDFDDNVIKNFEDDIFRLQNEIRQKEVEFQVC